jgi:hypothetical protein
MFKKVQLNIYEPIILKTQKVPYKENNTVVVKNEIAVQTEGINREYYEVKNEYLRMIKDYRENDTELFVGGMPVQLEKNCMSQLIRKNQNGDLVYGMTLKVDGERYLMFLSSNQNVYLIDRSTNIFYFQTETGARLTMNGTPFLFDGELIESKGIYEYLVFDVLFFPWNGKLYSWINNNYNDRHYILYNAVKQLEGVFIGSNMSISEKRWFPITDILKTTNIYKYVQTETNKNRKSSLKADGLILQPFDGKYIPFRAWDAYNNVQFKWKPADDLTIDFKIKKSSGAEWILLTQSGQEYMIDLPVKLRKDKKKKEQVPARCLPTETQKERYTEGDVVEFKKKENTINYFVPLRKRNEKKANSYQTIMSTMQVIDNPFSLDILKPVLKYVVENDQENIANVLEMYPKNKLILCALGNSLFFNNKEVNEIEKIYKNYIEHDSTKNTYFELECRIFKSGKKNQGLDKFTYFYVLDFLKSFYDYSYSDTTDVILSKPGQSTHRSTYENDKLIRSEIKTKMLAFTNDSDELSFKLSLSKEEVSSQAITLKTKIGNNTFYNIIRVKKRHSFKINDFWRIDITRVMQTYDINDIKNETYELECEYIGKKVPFEDFIKSLNDVYVLILKNSSYC